MENPSRTKSRSSLLTGCRRHFRSGRSFNINASNIFDIGWGFGLSASGGGGSLVDGIGLIQTMLDRGFESIDARSTSLAPLNEAAVISGGMGAPSAISGGLEAFVPSCLAALNALRDSGLVPERITGITPIEAGPVNGILPVYISWQSNGEYILYDCDGAGRAVPSLTNLLFDFERIPFSPSAQANLDATQTLLNTTWANGAQAEAGLRDVIAQYGGAIGLAAWPQNGLQLALAALVQGTFFTAATYGQQTYALRSSASKLLDYLAGLAPNPEFKGLVWQATFNEIYRDPDGLANGYDKGYIVFGRNEIEPGIEYRMYYLNENMFVSRHVAFLGEFLSYVATAPSSISCYFSDPHPHPVLRCDRGDFIPYNTGDNDIIEALVGQQMLVGVTSPTGLLYSENVKQSFVTVLNDYFSEPPYGFEFGLSDIFPQIGD